jgi:hypothetical protein
MNFAEWLKSMMSQGTSDSLARLIFFVIGIITAVCFLAAIIFSMWTHHFTPDHVYDLPRNIAGGLRDVFVAAGAGKVIQRIYGEKSTPPAA